MSLRSRGNLSVMAAQTRAVLVAAAAGWESPSATTLDVPGRYTSWLVYSEMKARWRCWQPEGSDAGGRDAVAQEIQLGDSKVALLQVEGEDGEQRAEMGPMLLSGFAEKT
jgi:hypothetical protein